MRYPAYQQFNPPRWPGTDPAPVGWEVRRLKFAATCNDESLSEATDPDYAIAYVDISSVDLVNGITTVEPLSFEEAPSRARRIVRDGDTVISTVRTYLKAIAAIKDPPDNMIVSTGFAVVRPLEFIDSGFLGYALQSTGFINAVVANSTGISYPAINPTTLVCLPVGYPKDKQEQQQIAAFLDWKTGQIDALVGRKKALLEKLTEKRIAVTTQAVTQGLNPAAPMRDSGTHWLGQVPQTWEVERLKDHGRLIGGAGFPIDEQGLTDEELPFYKVGDLKEAVDGRNMASAPNTISRETADKLRATVIPPNSVVYAKIGAALLLNRRRVTSVPCCIDNNMTAYIPDPERLEIRWVHYWLSILDFGEFVNPGAVPSLSEGYQSVLPIFVPRLEEQAQIADYLDSTLPKIDQLVDATERTIASLSEYRTALITAATKGEIDVRKVKPATTA